jgi:hypothetical protein
MDPSHVRAFVNRNRALVQDAKAEYWAQRYRDLGWRANWELAQELYAHARRVRPDFPTDRDRTEDYAHHVRLKSLIDRAAHAFRRR